MKGPKTSVGVLLKISAFWAALAVLCYPGAFSNVARAQTPNRQCGDYVEAYKGGPGGYGTYLQATADVAKSRDAQEGSSRYSRALQSSSAPSNALWLKNWCTKNPLRGFTEASSRLLDELTGQTSGPSPAASYPAVAPPQVVVVTPPPPRAHVGRAKSGSARAARLPAGTGARQHAPKAAHGSARQAVRTSRAAVVYFLRTRSRRPPEWPEGPLRAVWGM
jgi:hypothetical protein